jgi:protoporphyrinogen/coproporphyrinogen III oxidase
VENKIMNTSNQTEVVIIGGGLTGLTTGFYLQKKGIAFKILEKDTRVGGVIQSHSDGGFLYESGPNTGVIGNPEVAELFNDLKSDCELEIADPEAKRRLILKKGKWHALPSGIFSSISTPLFSVFDKFRILGEPFRKKGKDSMESVAGMIKRRLGKTFLDYAINPFIAGIYAGNPDKLITKYALPKMYALEYVYGSLIKGGIKKSRQNKLDPRMALASREVFSVSGGLENLIKALQKQIPAEKIQLHAESVSVQKTKNGYITTYSDNGKQEKIESKYLVSTVGAHSLPDLFPFIEKEAFALISNLEYAKVVLVILGYNDWNGMPLNAFGGLIPSKEKKNILGILFTSSFFKNRAPKDGALLSVFLGGTRLPTAIEMTDEEIEELVLANIKEMLGTELSPDLLKIFRYPYAIAQYEESTKERLEAIDMLEKEHHGLFLAGNIRDGIGMADRIKQGRQIAEQLGYLIEEEL